MDKKPGKRLEEAGWLNELYSILHATFFFKCISKLSNQIS